MHKKTQNTSAASHTRQRAAVQVEPKDALTPDAGDHLADAVADICAYFARRRAARSDSPDVIDEDSTALPK